VIDEVMEKVEAIIIGAGVVGLAIGAKLSKDVNNVLIIDKNPHFGEETSSRNSEVIHAGIYYPQHSLKAKLCVKGKEKLYQYCKDRNIPHQRLGKILVAHGRAEEVSLKNTLKQAALNGVNDLTWLTESELKVSNPELHATASLLSPSTGIIDVHRYMQALLADIEHNKGQFVGQTQFINAEKSRDGFIVTLNSQGEIMQLHCHYLINAGGITQHQSGRKYQCFSKNTYSKTLLLSRALFFLPREKPFYAIDLSSTSSIWSRYSCLIRYWWTIEVWPRHRVYR
jgi:L-2-hydroxyglutarate oxidase LhgO